MQRNIEKGQSHIDYEEFKVLNRYGMVAEGEIPRIEEVEKVVIFDGLNDNRREISTRTQVMYAGIGNSRKAITVFVPDRETLEDLRQS